MLSERTAFSGLHGFAPHVGQETGAVVTSIERSQIPHDVSSALCSFTEGSQKDRLDLSNVAPICFGQTSDIGAGEQHNKY